MIIEPNEEIETYANGYVEFTFQIGGTQYTKRFPNRNSKGEILETIPHIIEFITRNITKVD